MISVKKLGYAFIIATLLYIGLVAAILLLNNSLQYDYKNGSISDDKTPIGRMIAGVVYQQRFYPDVDIIDGITIQIATYNQKINDTLNIKIYDNSTELTKISLSTKEIKDWEIINLPLETPLKVDKNAELTIELISDNGTNENAISLVATNTNGKPSMIIDGNEINKQLNFDIYGKKILFIGQHYILISVLIYCTMLVLFMIIIFEVRNKRQSLLINVINNFIKYHYLLNQLIIRDFKVKYKRSILGILWSLLNPLLMMAVQYIVFSNIFKFDIPNYALYLLIGIVMFSFFIEATTNGMGSIVTNASLITKVYVPKYIFPVSKVLSTSINLILSIIPLFAVMIITNIRFTSSIIFLPYFISMLIFFTIGMSLALSTFMVFFRDIQFLWGVIANIWMYATPIIYPITILPDVMQKIMVYNPIYHYINAIRLIIIDGQIPNINIFVYCIIYAAAALIIGGIIFKKQQNKFALYI
ncbi:MAG: ABC transporter permease [Mucispirillum sp.]|uniref:Transport permease protein n=1 Tax=Candidatus Mucispirillum faecigallinarum TaxID=2838699 RepID=A0A9D2GTF2_9BACT|nr:ABC transporter permease [Mucispirillum sp.]HIZ88680.1 ABC transporter permease [Candidatus Mucispirillum faecigallinarum]